MIYPRNTTVSPTSFERPEGELEALYGLPREVTFCSRCVMSNQRPNSAAEYLTTRDSAKSTIHFDADRVCDACRAAEQKPLIDWQSRERELIELCDRFRRDDGRYDCVVPGSGGKDSFYAAHMLKYQYNMHPLTVTWAPHNYTDWGWRNFQAWIHAGFDNQLFTPNGRVHRLLTRLATEELFHPFQPFIIGQKSVAPRVSALYEIPLVFYGENEAEYGNPRVDNQAAQRDWKYFTAESKSKIRLSGVPVAELTDRFGLEENDLLPYLPPDPEALQRAGTEVHYLGYYLKWHPQECFYYSCEHGKFEPAPERSPGTFSKYNSIDDKVDDLHYFTTFIKFGIGRATYDAAQEIRNQDITREEGVALVQRFDGEFPERFVDDNFSYLSLPEEEFAIASRQFEQPEMDRDYFMHLCDRYRSPHLWTRNNGAWSLRHVVYNNGVARR